jgi:magnesium transporter
MTTPLTRAQFGDPVTQHMHQNFTRLFLTETVGEALNRLREQQTQGRIIYFYVVDPDGRLQGVVPARRLILSPGEKRIADIMIHRVVTLPAEATVLEACEFFIQHRLLALPVVDREGRILGAVDVELYTKDVGPLGELHSREDLFQLIGVRVADAWQDAPLFAFRRRFPWLLCNLGAGILAAFLAGVYRDTLNRVVALAFFIPVVLNLAESVSSQSVSLALQGLRSQPPTLASLLRKLGAELTTGGLLGFGSGAIIALVALVWLWELRVALCLVGGITGGVAGAAVLGLSLPLVLRLLRLEPRVAAGPVALAGADVLTILLYLQLARWLLG